MRGKGRWEWLGEEGRSERRGRRLERKRRREDRTGRGWER